MSRDLKGSYPNGLFSFPSGGSCETLIEYQFLSRVIFHRERNQKRIEKSFYSRHLAAKVVNKILIVQGHILFAYVIRPGGQKETGNRVSS